MKDVFDEHEKEEIKISNKDYRDIESDMLNEINQSEYDNAEKSTGNINEQNQAFNEKIQIPKEAVKGICGGISCVIHERRIKTLPEELQKDARAVVKPTDSQVDNMASMVTWVADRYAPTLMTSPYIVPLTALGSFTYVEIMKYFTLSSIIERSRGERNE